VFLDQIFEHPLGDVRFKDPHRARGAIDRRRPLALVAVLLALLPYPGRGLIVALPDAVIEVSGQPADHRLVASVRESEATARQPSKVTIGPDDHH